MAGREVRSACSSLLLLPSLLERSGVVTGFAGPAADRSGGDLDVDFLVLSRFGITAGLKMLCLGGCVVGRSCGDFDLRGLSRLGIAGGVKGAEPGAREG